MFERDSRYVGAEGLRVRYRVRGPRSAPPLVLLHGIMGNAWEWDAAVERLLPRFRVYAPELRGHGRTEWRQPYTVPRLGDDVATRDNSPFRRYPFTFAAARWPLNPIESPAGTM